MPSDRTDSTIESSSTYEEQSVILENYLSTQIIQTVCMAPYKSESARLFLELLSEVSDSLITKLVEEKNIVFKLISIDNCRFIWKLVHRYFDMIDKTQEGEIAKEKKIRFIFRLIKKIYYANGEKTLNLIKKFISSMDYEEVKAIFFYISEINFNEDHKIQITIRNAISERVNLILGSKKISTVEKLACILSVYAVMTREKQGISIYNFWLELMANSLSPAAISRKKTARYELINFFSKIVLYELEAGHLIFSPGILKRYSADLCLLPEYRTALFFIMKRNKNIGYFFREDLQNGTLFSNAIYKSVEQDNQNSFSIFYHKTLAAKMGEKEYDIFKGEYEKLEFADSKFFLVCLCEQHFLTSEKCDKFFQNQNLWAQLISGIVFHNRMDLLEKILSEKYSFFIIMNSLSQTEKEELCGKMIDYIFNVKKGMLLNRSLSQIFIEIKKTVPQGMETVKISSKNYITYLLSKFSYEKTLLLVSELKIAGIELTDFLKTKEKMHKKQFIAPAEKMKEKIMKTEFFFNNTEEVPIIYFKNEIEEIDTLFFIFEERFSFPANIRTLPITKISTLLLPFLLTNNDARQKSKYFGSIYNLCDILAEKIYEASQYKTDLEYVYFYHILISLMNLSLEKDSYAELRKTRIEQFDYFFIRLLRRRSFIDKKEIALLIKNAEEEKKNFCTSFWEKNRDVFFSILLEIYSYYLDIAFLFFNDISISIETILLLMKGNNFLPFKIDIEDMFYTKILIEKEKIDIIFFVELSIANDAYEFLELLLRKNPNTFTIYQIVEMCIRESSLSILKKILPPNSFPATFDKEKWSTLLINACKIDGNALTQQSWNCLVYLLEVLPPETFFSSHSTLFQFLSPVRQANVNDLWYVCKNRAKAQFLSRLAFDYLIFLMKSVCPIESARLIEPLKNILSLRLLAHLHETYESLFTIPEFKEAFAETVSLAVKQKGLPLSKEEQKIYSHLGNGRKSRFLSFIKSDKKALPAEESNLKLFHK